MRYKISRKYLNFEIMLKNCQLSKVYYIEIVGKIANLNLVSFTGYF